VLHHPELRQGERQKCPDREQRDQPIGDAPERDQQRPREDRQRDDAARVDQTPAALGEELGQVAILGEHPTEPRKVGEARVGGERQHRDDGRHGDGVERAPADDGAHEHGQDALIAILPGLGGADAVRPA
jgi:hypothetical protein